MTRKKWAALAVKFAVSGALIAFLLGKVDLSAAWTRFLQVAPEMLVLSTAIAVVQIGIMTLRWMAVLNAINTPLRFWEACRLFYIAAFFNQTLPSAVGGDVVRAYMVYKTGIGLGPAINGVMLERVATVAGLVALVIATQPFLLSRVSAEAGGWILPTAIVLAAGMVAGMVFLMVLDRLPAAWRRWRMVRGLSALAADTRRVFLSPGPAFKAMAWSVAGHLNITTSVYVLAVGLDIDVGWMDCLALFPPVMLVMTLPISIAGWGVREASMVAGFQLIGVPGEGALVLSLLYGLMGIAVALPGGLVWLSGGYRSRGLADIAAETEALASAEKPQDT